LAARALAHSEPRTKFPVAPGKKDTDYPPDWALDINVDSNLAKGNRSCDSRSPSYCLAKTLAHEALHLGGHDGGPPRLVRDGIIRWHWEDHGSIRNYVDKCVTCPP